MDQNKNVLHKHETIIIKRNPSLYIHAIYEKNNLTMVTTYIIIYYIVFYIVFYTIVNN